MTLLALTYPTWLIAAAVTAYLATLTFKIASDWDRALNPLRRGEFVAPPFRLARQPLWKLSLTWIVGLAPLVLRDTPMEPWLRQTLFCAAAIALLEAGSSPEEIWWIPNDWIPMRLAKKLVEFAQDAANTFMFGLLGAGASALLPLGGWRLDLVGWLPHFELFGPWPQATPSHLEVAAWLVAYFCVIGRLFLPAYRAIAEMIVEEVFSLKSLALPATIVVIGAPSAWLTFGYLADIASHMAGEGMAFLLSLLAAAAISRLTAVMN